MQLLHLLPMTTVVFFIRFHVVGQVMSWELYWEELWVCWVPALCSEYFVGWGEVAVRDLLLLREGKYRLRGALHEFCTSSGFSFVPTGIYFLASRKLHMCVQKVPLIHAFLLPSTFLWLQETLNCTLPLLLACVTENNFKSTIIFNRFRTGIWKDKVLLNRIKINSGCSPIAPSFSPPSLG